jgi:hypothetical protein
MTSLPLDQSEFSWGNPGQRPLTRSVKDWGIRDGDIRDQDRCVILAVNSPLTVV